MTWLNRLNTALILAVAIGMAGCSTAPAHAQAAQDGDESFSVEDENVRGFAALTPDGYLEIIHNRAFTTDDQVERYAPGSRYFQLFTSALGGLEVGEIKRVPEYSGLAFMESDGRIVVNYMIHSRGVHEGDVDPIYAPSPSFSYAPSDPTYSVYMDMYRVRKPGDGYLIPAR